MVRSKHVGVNFLKVAKQHPNIGYLKNPNGRGRAVGECGDSVEVFLKVKEGVISDIKVLPRGCVYTWFCAGTMSELVMGKDVDDALYLGPDEIAAALGGLPEEYMHCARLAIYTLGEAVEGYYGNLPDRASRG